MEINSEEKLSFLCLFHFVYFLTSLEFLEINEGLAVKNEQSGRGMSLNFIVAKMTRNIYVGRQKKKVQHKNNKHNNNLLHAL